MFSLNPPQGNSRTVDEVTEAALGKIDGVEDISLLRMKEVPPTARDISIKIRDDNYENILVAANRLKDFMESTDYFFQCHARLPPWRSGTGFKI